MSVAYPFILDFAGYSAQIINLFVVLVRVIPLFSSSPQLHLIVSNRAYSISGGRNPIYLDRSKALLFNCIPVLPSLLITDNVVWLPLAVFFLLVEVFCTSSHALFEHHKERLTCLSPSDNLPISASGQWGRRHTPASLLPILSCRDCCLDAWGALLGHLEARASICIQIPLGI